MYRLIKSKKISVGVLIPDDFVFYRQIEVDRYRQLSVALIVCEVYNANSASRHYILNEYGEEYCEGSWIG